MSTTDFNIQDSLVAKLGLRLIDPSVSIVSAWSILKDYCKKDFKDKKDLKEHDLDSKTTITPVGSKFQVAINLPDLPTVSVIDSYKRKAMEQAATTALENIKNHPKKYKTLLVSCQLS